MKHKLKRLLALTLCAVMLSSPFTEFITPASAADAPGAAVTPEGVDLLNFRDQDNGRPNLFVDFLGDNRSYQPDHSTTMRPGVLVAPAGFDQSAVTNPNLDPTVTAPDADNPCNTWKLYSENEVDKDGVNIYRNGETIFWVGVGVDRKEMWKVLEGNQGLTSFEAGFYYDDRFIEPYVDPSLLPAGTDMTTATAQQLQDAYKATIKAANVNNPAYPSNTQWSGAYDVVDAVTAQDVSTAGSQFAQYDPITQEEMEKFSMDEILTGYYNSKWKMTYVSLELTDLDAARRLQGVYAPPTDRDDDGNVIVPPGASGDASDGDYQYLLLIPFRLKQFGHIDRTALRLIRNATHFSVGGGADGTDPYAAWERVTTRNEGKDVKLLNNFLGDLNLFSGGRFAEVEYTVSLEIDSDGGTWNRAELGVDGDPALYPVKATQTGDVIRGLQSGIGMELKTHTETGYKVKVTVSYPDRAGTKYPYETVVGTGPDQDFKFVIPILPEGGRNVHVLVEFIYDTASELNVYLSDVAQVDDPDAVYGNETTIYTDVGADGLLSTDGDGNVLNPTINSYDPPSSEGHPSALEHPDTMQDHKVGPACKADKDKTVRVEVKTHHDYQALVRLLDFRSGNYIDPKTVIGGTKNTDPTSPGYLQITLPQGGTVEFVQPNSDVDVEVRYVPATTHKATLEVWHDTANGAQITDMNTAQLSYLSYNELDVPSAKYSGVVYEDYDAGATPILDDHRAVKTGADNKILGWVPTSQAALSGSLGGDAEVGTTWTNAAYSPIGAGYLMSLLYSATSASAFAGSVQANDFSTLEVVPGLTGLRKDLQGQLYGDGADVTQLSQILWEMRQRIMADATLKAAYEKKVTLPSDATTTAYAYLDLTPAQVQAYQLEVLEAEAIAPKNVSEYRKTQKLFRQAQALYEQAAGTAATANVKPLQALKAPKEMSLDDTGASATWRRTYQGADYQDYIDDYNAYIRDYILYADVTIKTGSVDTTVTFPTLTAPAVKTVEILPDADTDTDATNDAQSVVSGYTWNTPAPSADNYVETREDRTVWVTAEGDSLYAVKSVVVRRDDGTSSGAILQTVTTPVAGYKNVYAFQMPQEDCVVQVTYELRTLRNLQWQVVGADGEKDNTAEIVAYRVTDHDTIYNAAPWNEVPATTPTRHVETNDGHWLDDPYPAAPGVIRNVFVGSTVTVRATHHKDYTIEVTVAEGNGTVTTLTGVAAGDPVNGYVYTYDVKNVPFDAVLTVTYKPAELPTNDAIITYETMGEDGNEDNWAFWHSEDAVGNVVRKDILNDVAMGTNLMADIMVAKGYYVHSVTATGASGSYRYTLEGNGYNNGYGTGTTPLNLWADMPGETLEVHVVFKKGPPPTTPAKTLTLTVKDEDNTDAVPADNWAKASVYDANADLTAPDLTTTPAPTASVVLGAVGKGATGGGVLSDSDYVDQDKYQWVYLDLNNVVVYKPGTTNIDPEKSYYINSITVSPSNLRVTVEWVAPNQARFLMPNGTAGVTVEFKKYPDTGFLPSHDLIVDRTETGGTSLYNQVTNANSATIRSWAATTTGTTLGTPGQANYTYPGTITNAAIPGEEITMTYVVAPPASTPDPTTDWYVQSVMVVYGGAAFSLTATPTGNPNEYTSKFIMPCEDARFVVNYRKGKPTTRDYTLTLILQDPDNDETPADPNTLTASFTDPAHTQPKITLGLAETGSPMMALTHAHAGDKVDLNTTLAAGYTLDFISIRPLSLGLYPSYVPPVAPATQTAYFTMPSADVVVVARVVKGTDKQYTANLILRPPAGYTPAQVGQGTFVVPNPAYDPTDPTAAPETLGSLNGYPANAIFSGTFTPGQVVDLDLFAKDGFYVRAVTVDPASGATTTLTGGFGSQQGTFTMPAADVYVNVWFEHKWPDEAQYNVTLNVHDAQVDPADRTKPGNYARFSSVDGVSVPNTAADPTGAEVYGGESRTITWDKSYAPYDRDTVVVAIHRVDGYHCDSSTISVTDADGDPVAWWYVPGGIAYTQPPQSVTVDVTFVPGNPAKHTATLHVDGAGNNADGTADSAQLSIHATGNAEAAPDNANPASVNTDGGQIVNLYTADTLKLTVQPATDRHVTAAYAVNKATNVIIPLYATADATGTVTFVPGDSTAAAEGYLGIPEGDVDVYVRFAEGKVGPEDYPVKLMVSGPADAGYASAVLDAYNGQMAQDMTVYTPNAVLPGAPANAVHAMDTRFTKIGNQVTVTFKPADLTGSGGDKYVITKLEVYDKNGESVDYEWISMLSTPPSSPSVWYPTWSPNPELQIKLSVPKDGVTVHVTYGAADDTEYRAQVVVNDDAYADAPTPSRNNAWLRKAGEGSALQAKLKTAKAGEWIDLDLLVHPGYKIEYVKVIPQSYGIAPALPQGPLVDQTTGFYMPAGDVTVYVKFVDDGIEEHNVTLIATGSTAIPDPANNYATIQSPRSGLKPNVPVNGTTQSVVARPSIDWVTVDYYWDFTRNSIASVTVRTHSGVNVPFTQELNDPTVGHGRLKLLVGNEDVFVTVVYANEPTPKPDPQGQQVVLHVIDKDGNAAAPITIDAGQGGANVNYGRLDYAGNTTLGYAGTTTGDIGPAFHPGNSQTILVPAGETVGVTACSDDNDLDGNGKVYIESAFVLYEAGGQMIEMNLTPDTPGPGFSGLKTSDFVVHPGVNDVYVTLTRTPPTQNEYSAVLMVKGPTDDCGSGTICVGNDYNNADPDRRDEVTQANHGYAYVTATTGEHLTVQIVPEAGYVIDRIVVTPLGFPLNYRQNGKTINFDMAHCNVAICVYLKQDNNQEHTVTLHYSRNDTDVDVTDKAVLSWTDVGAAAPTKLTADVDPATVEDVNTGDFGPEARMVVREDSTVTLDAYLHGADDRVLAAYALSDGVIVPLTPALEGTSNTESDATKPDGTAQFKMPHGDVDVYLVTATDVPEGEWHTAVLIAYDYSTALGNNQGNNKGHMTFDGATKTAVSTGHPGHVFMPLADGDNFTVRPENRADYTFNDPATMTTSLSSTPVNLGTTMTNPFIYNLVMGPVNEAIVLKFSSDEQLKLTVEIEDPDNPGDGSVTNAVDATTTGLSTLNLRSQSAAGSYQIMEGVTANAPVTLKVKPANGDYMAVAQLHKIDTTTNNLVVEAVTLTKQPDGTYTGSFPMPENDARVVVTFFKGYKGTLTLIDHVPGDSVQAKMTESFYQPTPKSVSVNSVYDRTRTIDSLPNGDTLTAEMVDFTPTATKTVTGLLTRGGSTTFLPASPNPAVGGADQYIHTIDRANAEITLVVDDSAVNPDTYIAAVKTVGMPTGTVAPAIVDATTAGQVTGSIWTTAKATDAVNVTFDVPKGYQAVVTAVTSPAGTGVDLTDGAAPAAASVTVAGPATGKVVSFAMPAANVQVTITYEKVEFDLTLKIVDSSGKVNATQVDPASILGGLASLTSDGDTALVASGVNVALSATPAADARIMAIYYQTDSGVTTWEVGAPMALGDPYTATFTMPKADTVVTVVYNKEHTPGPDDPTDPYYIAAVEVIDPDHRPGNKAVSLVNENRTTLLDGTPLPGSSPNWIAAYGQDGVTVSYEVEDGYFVTVSARRADNGDSVPILQMGVSTIGTASATMPHANLIITLRYGTTPPVTDPRDVALQLLEHEAQAGNKAATTDFTSPGTLTGLATDGTTHTHAPHDPAYTLATDPVETVKSASVTGNDLRTLANWADGYQVVRMTVALRDKTTLNETPEVDLLVSRYGSAATTRCPMPPTGANEVAVIRVYYGNIYNATFHLVGADAAAGDATSATDNQASTTALDSDNNVISKPIKKDLDWLDGYQGDRGEDIQTTATPGTGRRLVGVVWESDLTGAAAATAATGVANRYDFTMPQANVDFYAVYEKEPDDPKDRTYIAKVAFDPDSVHQDNAQNAVSIANTSDATAPGGKYWVGAKGGNSVEVTVKVAPGYQAEIVTTKIDDETKLGDLPQIYDPDLTPTPGLRPVRGTDAYQYYTSRTLFIPNLPTGKTSTFTMPLNTDATVTVKYTKNYDFTLEMKDQTSPDTALTTGEVIRNQAVATLNDVGPTHTTTYGSVTAVVDNDGSAKTSTTKNSVTAGTGPHTTTLSVDNGGDSRNTVKIYPTAQHTVYVSGDNSSIVGLSDNDRVTVFIETAPNYRAELHVEPGIFTETNSAGGTYEFTIPANVNPQTVEVKVTFSGPVSYSLSPYAATTGDTIYDLPGNLDVSTAVATDLNLVGKLSGVTTRVTRTTPFTGTTTVPAGDGSYPFRMPYEDTLETVLLKNANDPDNLMAKVALKGDSDVTGNTATPIGDLTDTQGLLPDDTTVTPANVTQTGTVWTTTSQGNLIDVKLTVAKGYVAKIKVRRDDSIDPNDPDDSSVWKYLDAQEYEFKRVWTVADTRPGATPGATMEMSDPMAAVAGIEEVQLGYSADALPRQTFPDSVSGEQHFRFTMLSDIPASGSDPAKPACDVTVIVEFVRSADIPQPFDPRNDETKTPSFLEQGFIYGENRGDFAVIEIPTLAKDESDTVKKLYDTDNYTSPPDATTEDANKDVTAFEFYLREVADDGTETYVRLVPGTDVVLTPYDPDGLRAYGDAYNYYQGEAQGMWTGTETWKDTTTGAKEYDFVGSKFKLAPTEPVTTGTGAAAVTARTAGAQKLYEMLNNKGSLETYTDEAGKTQYRTQLFVIAKDAIGGESDYTQVWIRPWFALAAKVVSYGPTHELTGELYRLMTEGELNVATGFWEDEDGTLAAAPPAGVTHTTPDPANFEHYKFDWQDTPDFEDSIVLKEEGSGKWFQTLRIRSSDLLGRYDKNYDPQEDATRTLLNNVPAGENLTYALEIEKASNLTYTRVKLNLNPNDPANTELYGPTQLAKYYDNATRTFTITDVIQLIAGDVDGNQLTKLQDYDQVYEFVYRDKKWSLLDAEPEPPRKADGSVDTTHADYPAYQTAKALWDVSTYNPKSMAYRCDLDGDRRLTLIDLDVVTTRFNYNRGVEDYLWTLKTDTTTQVLPFGLGAGKSSYAALFSLQDAIDGELLGDLYWDEQVDPRETEAEPLDNPVVDANGQPWIEERPETPPDGGPSSSTSVETLGERPEIPLGEEAMDRVTDLPAIQEEPVEEEPGEDPTPAAPVEPEAGETPETPAAGGEDQDLNAGGPAETPESP